MLVISKSWMSNFINLSLWPITYRDPRLPPVTYPFVDMGIPLTMIMTSINIELRSSIFTIVS